MKINGVIENCLVMTKKESIGKKDPSKKYWNLGIVQGDELGEISCVEEVFDKVDKMKAYNFSYSFNSEYQLFQIVGIVDKNAQK